MLRNTFVAVFAGADDDMDGAPLTEEQKQEVALRTMREEVSVHVDGVRRPGAAVEAAQLWGHNPRE
eukprot:8037308-Pyramimonas_sp.AAC.1